MAKELAAKEVGEAVVWMEMLGIAAILSGSLAGGFLIDTMAVQLGSPWTAAILILGVLAIGCGVAILGFRNVPRNSVAATAAFGWQALLSHAQLLSSLRKNRSMWRAAVGDNVFYFVGGMAMLALAQAGRDMFPDGAGAARRTGLMLALLGAGIATGSTAAARLGRRAVSRGIVPFGTIGMAVALSVLAMLTPGSLPFLVALTTLGIGGGLYLVPLAAFLVDRSQEGERGLVASSMLSGIGGVLAVCVHRLTGSPRIRSRMLNIRPVDVTLGRTQISLDRFASVTGVPNNRTADDIHLIPVDIFDRLDCRIACCASVSPAGILCFRAEEFQVSVHDVFNA
jgi:acyl-[acyl-carrier-protein]-phospholipid O-acyltransferase/long-chain-fatty-acid--[acyl-carrier-protein] ligase